MPGGDDDADDVIVLDSASDRESNGAVDDSDDEVLFEGTFAIGDKKKKKNKNNKSQHTRFVSESSSGNEGEQRRCVFYQLRAHLTNFSLDLQTVGKGILKKRTMSIL